MEPRRIGPYRLESKLGAGGMGEVFRAYDDRLDRWVAIKLIRPEALDSPEARRRFRREARAAARLSHPAIVQIHDILENQEGDSIVMELVEGRPLSELLAEGSLNIATAVALAREIIEGLAEAHAKEIVHRDLKADNVMVTPAGHAKILDFGLAKRLSQAETDLSVEGKILGTVHAMSPEQAQGFDVDHRSDLFSLGSLLYRAVTHQSPFRGDSPVQTLTRITTFRQTPAHEMNPQVPEALSLLIDQLLEKDPLHRPRDADEVATALDNIIAARERVALEAPTLISQSPAIPRQPRDAVLKTLLVSDLVGSTRRVELLGDAGSATLFQNHDRRARDLILELGGREIDKTDGFLLLFERPIHAVIYAQAYHQALRELSAEAGVTLTARIGIHLGEIILRENIPEDIARGAKPLEVEGLAKPMAARLMSLAESGQTLITRAAFDTARRGAVGTEPATEDLRWLTHGSYRLKGIEEPIEIFEVGVEGIAPLERPRDCDKAKRVETQEAGSVPTNRRWLKLAVALILLSLGLLGTWASHRRHQERLHAAVLKPRILSDAEGQDSNLVTAAVRQALVQALLSRQGISTPDPDEVDKVSGTSAQIARVLGVDEVITSNLTCDHRACQIELKRIHRDDGNTLEFDLFEVFPGDLLELTSVVSQRLRNMYPAHKARPGVRDMRVAPKDYERFLSLRRTWQTRSAGASPAVLLEAVTALESTSPRFPDAYLLEARIAQVLFVSSKRPEYLERALGAVQRARDLAPEDSRALFVLFNIALEGGRTEQAANALQALRRVEPGHGRILAQQALLLEAQGQALEALVQMRNAAERHPSRSNLMDLVRMEVQMGELDAARNHLREVLERSPNDYLALFQLAIHELKYGSLAQATELFEQLRLKTPSDAGASHNIGLARFGMARYEEAAECFREVLDLEPSHLPATAALAFTQFLLADPESAKAFASKALELSTGNTGVVSEAGLHFLRAMAWVALDEGEQAVAAIQQILPSTRANPFRAWQAALIYAAVGEELSAKTKAREALEQGLTPEWFASQLFDFLRQDPELHSLLEK